MSKSDNINSIFTDHDGDGHGGRVGGVVLAAGLPGGDDQGVLLLPFVVQALGGEQLTHLPVFTDSEPTSVPAHYGVGDGLLHVLVHRLQDSSYRLHNS